VNSNLSNQIKRGNFEIASDDKHKKLKCRDIIIIRNKNMKSLIIFVLSCLLAGNILTAAEETLSPLEDGKVPQNLDELWGGYDPKKEPLEMEVLKEWEQDGVIYRIIRYQVGVFKGAPAKLAAFYAFPKGGTKLPALVQIHGGGQSASLACVVTDAKRGYASISLNWGGNKMNLGKDNWEGPQTDWGKLDCTHPPQRNKSNHFAGPLTPDEYTLDNIESPRNSNCRKSIQLGLAHTAIPWAASSPLT
jgi:hypothetical protein